MTQASEFYLDAFDPGWRERQAKTDQAMREFSQSLPPRQQGLMIHGGVRPAHGAPEQAIATLAEQLSPGDEIKTLRLVNKTFALHIGRMEQQLQERNADAARYAWLRDRDLESINLGGLFVGRTPDNLVVNGDDLDAAIDERLLVEQMAPRQQATPCGECHLQPGERCNVCGALDVR